MATGDREPTQFYGPAGLIHYTVTQKAGGNIRLGRPMPNNLSLGNGSACRITMAQPAEAIQTTFSKKALAMPLPRLMLRSL